MYETHEVKKEQQTNNNPNYNQVTKCMKKPEFHRIIRNRVNLTRSMIK